jgi:hypothetical protein
MTSILQTNLHNVPRETYKFAYFYTLAVNRKRLFIPDDLYIKCGLSGMYNYTIKRPSCKRHKYAVQLNTGSLLSFVEYLG